MYFVFSHKVVVISYSEVGNEYIYCISLSVHTSSFMFLTSGFLSQVLFLHWFLCFTHLFLNNIVILFYFYFFLSALNFELILLTVFLRTLFFLHVILSWGSLKAILFLCTSSHYPLSPDLTLPYLLLWPASHKATSSKGGLVSPHSQPARSTRLGSVMGIFLVSLPSPGSTCLEYLTLKAEFVLDFVLEKEGSILATDFKRVACSLS